MELRHAILTISALACSSKPDTTPLENATSKLLSTLAIDPAAALRE